MKNNYFTFFILLIISTLQLNAQELISAKLQDSITNNSIPFATVSFNNTSGVISNENGVFQIQIKNKIKPLDTLFISCLGYETKNIAALNFKDSIVLLKPKSIELKEVLISNKNYTAEEIIEKVYENLSKNYQQNYTKNTLFYRTSYFTNILKNKVDVKDTSIKELNQNFIDSILMKMPKETSDFTEVLGELYTAETDENNQKFNIIKAAHLFDKNSELNFEAIEKKLNTILKKHIKRDSYFKIKSGLFGTKQDIDSTFFDGEKKDKNETEAFLEEKRKQEQAQKNNFLKYRKQSIVNVEKSSFIHEDSHLNFLEKSRKYDFELLDYIYLNDNLVYKLTFSPKRSADYKGVIYINTDDFAIIRVDYENVKSLKTFKLLGISYNENIHKGTFIYSKDNTTNFYNLKYAESESGSEFGVKRPLKIIEKNKNTKGRRKQNEISMDVHFIISNTQKKELVFFENTPITEAIFNAFTEKADVKATFLPKYDADFWKGYNIIEPNQAITNFKSTD
jgi:hypothetical protein